MKVLGIESTAHTFSIAIASKQSQKDKMQIHANVADKYPSSQEGYIPRKLADHHVEVFPRLLQEALSTSNVLLEEIDAVAFSQGSGIGHCLHVGYVAAKTLATKLKAPLVPVNHSVAHIEIGREFSCRTRYPLVVYVSGGNTQITELDERRRHYHIYGETTDIGLGNFLDVLGRKLELDPPDAVGVVNAAKLGKNYLEMPYTVRGMNLAFSGLQTFIEKKLIPEVKNGKISREDVALSSQETAFAMLCEAVERALCHTGKTEVLLCGGNARNGRLQEMLKKMCGEHEANFAVTSFEYSGDQAAMIALTAIKMLEKKCVPRNKAPSQRLRTDATHVCW